MNRQVHRERLLALHGHRSDRRAMCLWDVFGYVSFAVTISMS
jgi:hypothetical protein